jgi:hypothetical protein
MKKMMKGQAAILIIFVLGMVALLIGVSLVKTGFAESIMGRSTADSTQAFYAANSGVEDALYRVGKTGYTFRDVSSPDVYNVVLEDSSTEKISTNIKIYGTSDEVTIESVGTYDNNIRKYIRKIKTTAENTSAIPGFINAIQAGGGGVTLDNTTEVTGKGGVPGNVYSKSYIKGKVKDDTPTGCKNAASAIYGSAWAVDKIDSLDPGKGVCITASASATFLNNCYVHGPRYSPNSPLSCNGGTLHHVDSIPVRELPDVGVNKVKNYLTSHGNVIGGCKLTGSGHLGDCMDGSDSLGDVIVNGDLEINATPGVTIKFTGPIWVTGNLIIRQNSRITPLSTTISQMTIVDKTITSESNVSYMKNVDAFLIFISTYLSGPDSTNPTFCDNPAITLSSNNNSVLFYSTVGCILINAHSEFKGAVLGEAVRVDNNSTVEYDPALQFAVFGLSSGGGWQISSFTER